MGLGLKIKPLDRTSDLFSAVWCLPKMGLLHNVLGTSKDVQGSPLFGNCPSFGRVYPIARFSAQILPFKSLGSARFFLLFCKNLIDYIKRLIHCYKWFPFQFMPDIFYAFWKKSFSIKILSSIRNVSLALNKMISDALYDRKCYGTIGQMYILESNGLGSNSEQHFWNCQWCLISW